MKHDILSGLILFQIVCKCGSSIDDNSQHKWKIVVSIMTLELLESTELDYIDFWCTYRGVSRISGKDAQMYKGTVFAFLYLSHFS